MLARCARVEPASVRARPGSAYFTSRRFSACTTLTPGPSARLREPLAPFSVTALPAIVAVTPCGRSTGALAILDMACYGLRPDCLRGSRKAANPEHVAALRAGEELLMTFAPIIRPRCRALRRPGRSSAPAC